MASLKKVRRGTKQDLKRWKILAREAAGKTRRMCFDHVFLYNRWFKNMKYREKLASEMGFKIVVENKRVYDFGGGSSYDGLKYDGCPEEMKVLERWRSFKDNKSFVDLFDREAVNLSNNLFGVIPGTEILTEK